jgi:AcrR family transcriptional regulator
MAERRVRLLLAMIDLIEQKGYRETTVADVIAQAKLSRKAFYEQFTSKQECLLATFDFVAEEVVRRLERAYGDSEGWPGRVEAAIRVLFESALENPGALRLSVLEIGASGPAGVERRERSIARYESFLRDALELAPGEGVVSDTVLRAFVGGIYRVLYSRVLHNRAAPIEAEELLALVPDLVAWSTSYYPTPAEILNQVDEPVTPRMEAAVLAGGRAPGTLAPHAPLGERRGLPRGQHQISHSFVVHNQRERILDAVANLTARNGYANLTVEEIAESAAVSLNAFYNHFADKEDAFLVAYEVGHGKCLTLVELAYSSRSDWREGIRAGIDVLFCFLAAEPSFARMALVDAPVASPRSAERSQLGVQALAQMLVPAPDEAHDLRPPSVVTIEAVSAGVFELCQHHALHGRIEELRKLVATATYFALTPFLGGEQAALIATA